jgi:hypothetical protein
VTLLRLSRRRVTLLAVSLSAIDDRDQPHVVAVRTTIRVRFAAIITVGPV